MMELPIDHLSYSAMRLFCSNPWLFKKQYILGIFDYKSTPMQLVGKGFHKYAECLYSGMSEKEATRKAYELADSIKDKDIDWGKTGSREGMLKDLARVIEIFMFNRADYGTIKATEYKKTVLPQIDDQPWPLAIKAVTDLVTEKDGKLHLWDWKVLTAISDPKEEKPDYIMQALFNYFTVKETMGEPVAMTFVEIKKSISKDGSPQIAYYEIRYDKHPEYFKYFGKMYAGVVDQLQREDYIFLPNFSDNLTAKEAWTDFTSETMDFAMPKQVTHKAPVMKNVEKNFVESSINHTEGEALAADEKITVKMLEFGIPLEYVECFPGANVTMYSFKPSRGVRMATIEKFDKDLQLALETRSVRILAPIPGKKLVGIEIPSEKQLIVPMEQAPAPTTALELPIGIDVYGKSHSIDLARAPHLLIGGSTGSGKSVALSVFIKTLMQNNTTQDLGMVLIDPKRSEFVTFEDSQHLLSPVITESDQATTALQWAVEEMETRYKKLKQEKSRNIDAFRSVGGNMPSIVIVIDELADLLLTSVREITENAIIRIAQKSRAVGIHLILATQRPSVDVVTGILKANFPTRLAFMTATQIDSKVILDQSGAEKLIGNGDCLLMQPRKDIMRLQGYFTE